MILLYETFQLFNSTKKGLKGVRIRNFSGPYFPAFGLNKESWIPENTDHKNSEIGHFSRSEKIAFSMKGLLIKNPTKSL